VRVALAQISPVVGDYAGNVARIERAAEAACDAGCQVLVAPELALSGYPPLDLLERSDFVEAGLAALQVLADRLPRGLEAVAGFVDLVSGPRPLRNAAALIREGRVVAVRHKRLLPTYDVFDEDRYFGPADELSPTDLAGGPAALTICEDIWSGSALRGGSRYSDDPVAELVAAGARLVVNISASPWRLGKAREREALLSGVAAHHGVPVLYANQVGGNDELLFDGGSLFVDAHGEVVARGAAFTEDLVVCDLDEPARSGPLHERVTPDEEAVRRAIEMGIRDYAARCGFSDVVLGLSGGVDSALVCALAAEALGPERVLAVAMPSRYSSEGSLTDARELAANLGVRLLERPIEGPFVALLELLADDLGGGTSGLTEENLQARVRGTLVMALSNQTGALALNTGNKSESAVGYCTLYGDMVGGLAPIGDLPKGLVYRVARHLNAGREVIPRAILDKEPSAELRPDQRDTDSLPPYDVLDEVLERWVVRCEPVEAIVAAGVPAAEVARVVALVEGSEYKRRQAPPALRVTSKAFGMGRRMPIARRRSRA